MNSDFNAFSSKSGVASPTQLSIYQSNPEKQRQRGENIPPPLRKLRFLIEKKKKEKTRLLRPIPVSDYRASLGVGRARL